MSGEAFEASLGRREKRQLGRAAKALLDLGRACGLLHAVSATGAPLWERVELIRYAPQSTTKENLLLIALPPGLEDEEGAK